MGYKSRVWYHGRRKGCQGDLSPIAPLDFGHLSKKILSHWLSKVLRDKINAMEGGL